MRPTLVGWKPSDPVAREEPKKVCFRESKRPKLSPVEVYDRMMRREVRKKRMEHAILIAERLKQENQSKRE